MDAMSDTQSQSSRITAETFKTDVSAWTQCSITSFSRLQTIWQADSKLHREMLAILAAITEVIKERNGQESETEYFAALLTTLDSVESADSRTAVLSLLSLLIKRVPNNVLRKQFSVVVKPLVKMLADNVQSENNALMRSVSTVHLLIDWFDRFVIMNQYLLYRSIDWLIDAWLTDRLIDWLIDVWVIDWLIDWSVGCSIDWLFWTAWGIFPFLGAENFG